MHAVPVPQLKVIKGSFSILYISFVPYPIASISLIFVILTPLYDSSNSFDLPPVTTI